MRQCAGPWPGIRKECNREMDSEESGLNEGSSHGRCAALLSIYYHKIAHEISEKAGQK